VTTPQDKQAAVNLAIDHILEHGFDDIAKPPIFLDSIELAVIVGNTSDFRREARRRALRFLNTANLQVAGIGNPQFYMVPKDEHTLRRVAWIDPFDLVKFLSVSLLLFPQIEASRAAKDTGIVHSHRRSDTSEAIFDADYGYDSFRRNSSQLSQQNHGKWKVITDISNFFDRVGNHPLENHLNDCGADPQFITLASEILFQWSGDRRSFGIPVGSDASRILSEAALVAVDRQLQERGITYVRYVDDFRMFADTRAEAYDNVRVLSELLAEEGLNLNNRKTRIFQIQDYNEAQEVVDLGINIPHDQIDTNERIEIQRRIQVSGRTSISRFYRHPGREALRRLSGMRIQEILGRVQTEQGAEQEEAIRTATKYFIYVRQDIDIIESLVRHKMTSVFYIVDALVKDAAHVDENVKHLVRNLLVSNMGGERCSYPFQIPLLRLCATQGYEDGTLANAIVDNQRQLDNLHFFREAILLGFQQMDRARIRRLATVIYTNAPPPLQRAIKYALRNYSHMSDHEKRPLLRNLTQTSQDWFVARI